MAVQTALVTEAYMLFQVFKCIFSRTGGLLSAKYSNRREVRAFCKIVVITSYTLE